MSPPATPKKMAIARPRSRTGNAATTIASAAGYMNAPPTPWMTRHVMIQAAAAPPVGVSPHAIDANVKITMPTMTIFRCPTVSDSRPPNANMAASASR